MVFTGPGFRPKVERNAPSRAEDLADFAVSYRGSWGKVSRDRDGWQLVGDRLVQKEVGISVSEVNQVGLFLIVF